MNDAQYLELGELLTRAQGYMSRKAIADRCGVSQTAVHKWVNGYSRPRPLSLAVLAALLKLDPREVATAAGYDQHKIVRLIETNALAEMAFQDFLETSARIRNSINRLWDTGYPESAIDEAEISVSALTRQLERYREPKHRRPLLLHLSQILHEHSNAICTSRPPREVWSQLQPLISKQERIAAEIADNEPKGHTAYMWGDYLYGLKQYRQAREYFQDAFRHSDDEYWKLSIARLMALCTAHLIASNNAHTKSKEYEKDEERVKRLLDNHDYSILMVAQAMEGLGRGQSLIGRREGLDYLHKGWSYVHKAERNGQPMYFKRLQLTRSVMVAHKQLGMEEIDYIDNLADDALELASRSGYKNSKYVAQIKKYRRSLHS